MRLFSRREADPIRVTINVRAFIDGNMVRVGLDAQAQAGDRLKDLLKQLGRQRSVDLAVVRYILRGNPGITVLRNGNRLNMPEAANEVLADGDEVSVLTPMAGG